MLLRRTGFTILELMIVVAIIAIIAAVALPSLAGARKSANEASAISSLRTIVTVNEQYRTRFQGYASQMSDLANAGYIDSVLGASQKAGYDFFYAGALNVWVCFANPNVAGETGDRFFFADQNGVIRFRSTGPADDTAPPVGGTETEAVDGSGTGLP